MPSKLLGPDFEDFTITYENLRWLHSCRWEGSHAEAFSDLRESFPNSFGKVPNLVKSKTHPTPSVGARWLLVDEDERASAWAELQSFPSQRDRSGILIWGEAQGEAMQADSLTRLISFCFIVGKFDHMKIAASSLAGAKALETYAQSVGEKRESLGLSAYPWFPGHSPIQRFTSFEVAKHEWRESPVSFDPSKTLSLIQSRIERFERAQTLMAPKRKRRSFAARLLRPKIDDPLF